MRGSTMFFLLPSYVSLMIFGWKNKREMIRWRSIQSIHNVCSQNNIEKHPHIDYKQGSLRSILAGMLGLPYISPTWCKYRSFESILGWVVILLSQSYWKASSPILIKNKVSLNRSWLGWCLFLSNILKWKISPRRSIVNRSVGFGIVNVSQYL